MALDRAVTHTTAADGTFSAAGAAEWNAAHTVDITGAVSGGIPYFDSTTSEATSALLAQYGVITGGGAGAAPYTTTGFTFGGSAAGTGLQWTCGTAAASGVPALLFTQTRNFNTSATDYVKWSFTETSSHASDNYFAIYGGASGTTLEMGLKKDGTLTLATQLVLPAGLVSAPAIKFSGDGRGIYFGNGGIIIANSSGVKAAAANSTGAGWQVGSDGVIGFTSSTDASGSSDASISRGGTNQHVFGSNSQSAGSGTATSRAEINKAVTTFTDAVAKTVFTITIPNAAHSAHYLVRLTGSIGAGGAIGANEASATNCYVVTVCRTAGVNAVATISSAFGAAASNVAGATTVTCTAALAAVSGAVGATNTIAIEATITKGGGSSDNHTCVATASLLNANATGITIA